MTATPAPARRASARLWLTDPLLAAAVLAAVGVLLGGYEAVLTWAVLGGLAGFSLSGSV